MRTPINEVREKRKDILLIITTVVIMTSAINFLTTYISGLFLNNPIFVLVIGVAIFLIGLFVLKIIFLKTTEHTIRIEGAISFNIKDEQIEPIEIACYDFNNKFCEYLHSFLSENKAYIKLIKKKSGSVSIMERFDPDKLDHFSIINSVIEYIILDELQLHLGSYFVKNEIDDSKIMSLDRSKLHPDILKNRVIDMITKDMSEREAFLSHSPNNSKGKVVYSTGANGIIYRNIEFQLPPKSMLSRNNEGYIVISNPLFNLTIIPQYEGFSTNVSPVFVKSENAFHPPLLVKVKLHVCTKNTLFISDESIKIYEWLDSFIERLEDKISKDKLEQRLNSSFLEFIQKSRLPHN